MKKILVAVLALALTLPLFAAELNGVKMDASTAVDGKQLTLNGMGLRTKMMFQVYVAGLYVESPSRDASAIIAADQVKQVRMVMMRDLGKGKIAEAVEEGFEKNSKQQMPALKQRLAQFVGAIPDLKKGQQLVITYHPGKGTVLTSSAGTTVTIPGKDFSDALFSVWLGGIPVDETLKKGLLGT